MSLPNLYGAFPQASDVRSSPYDQSTARSSKSHRADAAQQMAAAAAVAAGQMTMSMNGQTSGLDPLLGGMMLGNMNAMSMVTPVVPAMPTVLPGSFVGFGTTLQDLLSVNVSMMNAVAMQSPAALPGGVSPIAPVPLQMPALPSMLLPGHASLLGAQSLLMPQVNPPADRFRRASGTGKGRAGHPRTASQAVPVLTSDDVADLQVLIDTANKRDESRCRAIVAHADFKGINEKDADGRSALHVAALRKLPEDLCIVILRHPDFKEVNAVDKYGYTALTLAASNGLSELCMALLERDDFTEVNCKDRWGATALHWAADSNLGAVCEAIMSNQGFVSAHTQAFSFRFENKTALQVAEERGHSMVTQAIRKHLRNSEA